MVWMHKHIEADEHDKRRRAPYDGHQCGRHGQRYSVRQHARSSSWRWTKPRRRPAGATAPRGGDSGVSRAARWRHTKITARSALAPAAKANSHGSPRALATPTGAMLLAMSATTPTRSRHTRTSSAHLAGDFFRCCCLRWLRVGIGGGVGNIGDDAARLIIHVFFWVTESCVD